MIILISHERLLARETKVAHALFERGLPLFHVRKTSLTDTDMQFYIDGIASRYRSRLVLHSHFHLAKELGISRLHIRESDREQNSQQSLVGRFTLSTSVHAISTYNSLETIWNYVFISPVFPSISKTGYGAGGTVLATLSQRRPAPPLLVALGGIDASNYQQALAGGADAVAVLGSIWNHPDPVAVFHAIQQSPIQESHAK